MKQEIFDADVKEYKEECAKKNEAYSVLRDAVFTYEIAEIKCKQCKKGLINSLMDNVKNYSNSTMPISYDQIKYITLLANRLSKVVTSDITFNDLPVNAETFRFTDTSVQIKYINKHVSIDKIIFYDKIIIEDYKIHDDQIIITVRFTNSVGDIVLTTFVVNKVRA